MSQCLLDSLDLDLITEVDHALKYCYCSKCTCGKHICPQRSPKSYPKSTFTSYYQLNYKKHKILRRPATSSAPYKRNQFKLESETTQSHDYKDWTPNGSFRVDTPKYTQVIGKFNLCASTTYKQDYSSRGLLKTELIKQKEMPINPGIKFQAVSTYATVYQKSPIKPTEMIKPHVNTNILCAAAIKTPQSMMKAAFSKCNPIPTHAIKHQDNTQAVPSHPCQYFTVNSVNYNKKPISSVIRRAHRSID